MNRDDFDDMQSVWDASDLISILERQGWSEDRIAEACKLITRIDEASKDRTGSLSDRLLH